MRNTLLKYKILSIFATVIILAACSTDKNTRVSRTYHNLTSYYNVYFNGKNAYKSGMKRIDASHKENYSLMIPVFKFSVKESARSSYGDMNKAIEKGSKCVYKHSITTKPKQKPGKKPTEKQKEFKKKNEFVKWVDDSYLLIGKANFIKGDYFPAIETFNFMIRQYGNNPIKYEAYMWMARTYIAMEKYNKADDFLSKLDADKDKIPEALIGPIAVTRADVNINKRAYAAAIIDLNEGISLTKNKKDRVRYLYLLAQLHQELAENKKAYEVYGQVIEMNPAYEMAFNAKINRASIFNSSAGDSKALQKQLRKMLKDDKNIDYRDQIYYALGNIEKGESHENEAIEFYNLSTQASTNNDYQKSLSYLSVADIYFSQPSYEESQVYYDSAVTYLSKEHPNFNTIKYKSDNLNELVLNMKTIAREDSLQRVASMSEEERNALIDKIISVIVKQEQLAKQREASMEYQYGGNRNNQTNQSTSGGKWYFYNPALLGQGEASFRKRWGDRKNEDNWRRKNKSDNSFENELESEESEEVKNQYSTKSREYYLVDLPLTDSAFLASTVKKEKAYYNLSTIYYEKFREIPLSIEGYNDLLKEYPETEYRLSIYYNLYKLYTADSRIALAQEYKEKIVLEFPGSDYAKILTNPEYYKELDKIENQVNFIYQATYKYFLNDNCVEVANNYHFVDSAYSESILVSKFALLNTLCEGRKGDSATFKVQLSKFITDYPGTEEIAYAQEVLYALDREQRVIELKIEEERVKEFGGDIAEGSFKDSMDVSMYNYDTSLPHYYLVVVNNLKADEKLIKFKLENFNLDYFGYLNFDVESELLSASYNMVLVKPFKNMKMAANYFESVVIAGEVLEDLEDEAYRTFIISSENYKLFMNDKSIARYQQFFDEHYSPGFTY